MGARQILSELREKAEIDSNLLIPCGGGRMAAIVIWVIGIMFTWGVLFGYEDEEVGWKKWVKRK